MMRSVLRRITGVQVLLLACCLVAVTALQSAVHPMRASAQSQSELTEGRKLFATYCASCHGVTGSGNGPVAASMRRSPPDVTGLALANGGMFPRERMGRIIDGRDVEAHGDRDMPVWGDAFKALRGGQSETAVRARIASIVAYLASIQRHQA